MPRIASARRRSGSSRRFGRARSRFSKTFASIKGEEANSPEFARALAELGDVYVDDAFSAAHRAHASIEALAHLLPAAAGKLMEAELEALTAALESPTRPVLALIGGAKVSTKLDLLRFLIGKVDLLAIGGAMANTLLLAEGKEVGRSLCERDMTETARQILALARQRNCRVILPEDAVVAAELAPGAAAREVAIDAVPQRRDDPRYRTKNRRAHRRRARRGAHPRLERAARALSRRRLSTAARPRWPRRSARSPAPESCSASPAAATRSRRSPQRGVTDELSYVSTAGGAFLEWLEGRELPGVAALTRCER